jgi:hypothetical protein
MNNASFLPGVFSLKNQNNFSFHVLKLEGLTPFPSLLSTLAKKNDKIAPPPKGHMTFLLFLSGKEAEQ